MQPGALYRLSEENGTCRHQRGAMGAPQQPAWAQPGTHGSLCLQSFPAAALRLTSPGHHAWQMCHPPGWRQQTLCCLFWALLLPLSLQSSQRLRHRAWLTPCSRCQSTVPVRNPVLMWQAGVLPAAQAAFWRCTSMLLVSPAPDRDWSHSFLSLPVAAKGCIYVMSSVIDV